MNGAIRPYAGVLLAVFTAAGLLPNTGCRSRPESGAASAVDPEPTGLVHASNAVPRLLWAGGEFTEGGAVAPDGTLFFSDIGNRILRFDPTTEAVSVFLEPSDRANGMMFGPDQRLFVCEGANGGGRRVSEVAPDGSRRTVADSWNGRRFNSPNDLAISRTGRIYMTDPRYVGDEPRDLDFEGVFVIDPDGSVALATRDVTKPNGILLSPDDRFAYVADHDGRPGGVRQLVRFSVAPDGTLAGKVVLHDFGSGRGIDGMTMDTDGNIYATAGTGSLAGVHVFTPDGRPQAFIPTPGEPANCVFGIGPQRHTLYILGQGPPTATDIRPHALYAVELSATGYHVWQTTTP